MTHEQWTHLKVGDVLIDHSCDGSPRRTVRDVTVVPLHGKGGSKNPERVVISIDGIKQPERLITVFEADDWMDGVGKRFVLATSVP